MAVLGFRQKVIGPGLDDVRHGPQEAYGPWIVPLAADDTIPEAARRAVAGRHCACSPEGRNVAAMNHTDFRPKLAPATGSRSTFSSIPVCAIELISLGLSAQVVPDPTTAAVLTQGAAVDQCPEMLLQRVAAGPGQFDGLAHGDAAVLAGELDDL